MENMNETKSNPFPQGFFTLVITEKPSVAKQFAGVLGAYTRKDGWYEGNGYLISWCLGHLSELAAPEVYDPKYKQWNISDLPILPMPQREGRLEICSKIPLFLMVNCPPVI